MHPTTSPWLAQLDDREPYVLTGKTTCDVAIIGAGIAGIATAYQLLMHSDKSVILLDAGLIAHGATGRNAGHVVNEFEHPLSDIISTYGTEQTLDALRSIESGWDIIEEMLSMSGLRESYDRCTSYNGYVGIETLLENLRTHEIRLQAGITHEPILVCNDPAILAQIPAPLLSHILPVPHSAVLELLKTDDTSFIGVYIAQIGCMNSAHFCTQLAAWMLKKFGDRFQVSEQTPVQTLTLSSNQATVHTSTITLTAGHVVLCTNGYKSLHIENTGDPIDPVFQGMVRGVGGYMTGYLDAAPASISALGYYHPLEFYLTRHPYLQKDGTVVSLTCLGGIDTPLDETVSFDPSVDLPIETEQALSHEILHTYRGLPETAHHAFLWQGLMGYTPNGIRRIGFEKRNSVLLYNLGCNGTGILPSIYGGKRIRQLLNGEQLGASIFDGE